MRATMKRLWWMSRPFVWRWRLGYWDWDATWVALDFAWGRLPLYPLAPIEEARDEP